MLKTKKQRIIFSAAVGLIFTALLSITGFYGKCEGIRDSVVRVHIIANSDTDFDQSLKLTVRDGLLSLSDKYLANCSDRDEAIKTISEHIPEFENKADEIISREGYNYPVNVSIGKAYFGTREYDSFTLPAGYYEALRVVIGEGRGHNWWCVMFPPVCVPAASRSDIGDVLTGGESKIVKNPSGYKMEFKCVEWYENLKKAINRK